MGLFKRFTIIVVYLSSAHVCAELSKAEKHKVMVFRTYLKSLARRSQEKPVGQNASKGIAKVYNYLVEMEKKDPASQAAQNIADTVNSIQGLTERVKAPEIKIVPETKKETPLNQPTEKIPPTQQTDKNPPESEETTKVDTSFEEARKKRESQILAPLWSYIKALEKKDVWTNDKNVIPEWKAKTLGHLKNPALLGITKEGLNSGMLVLDALVSRYDEFIWSAYANNKNFDSIIKAKNKVLNELTQNILDSYGAILNQPGVLWSAQEKTIDVKWLKDVEKFLCYALGLDFSAERWSALQTSVELMIAKKYVLEQSNAAPQLAIAREALVNNLNVCKQQLEQEKRSRDAAITMAKKEFVDYINGKLAAARRTSQGVQDKHKERALFLAKNWIDLVPIDQLQHVITRIDSLYGDSEDPLNLKEIVKERLNQNKVQPQVEEQQQEVPQQPQKQTTQDE